MFMAYLKRPLVAVNDMFRKMPRIMTFYDPIGENAGEMDFFSNARAAAMLCLPTVFENNRKSLIQLHCERSELRLHFEWTKVVQFGEFLKTYSLWSNRVTRRVSFNRSKIGGKGQKRKIQMRHFE